MVQKNMRFFQNCFVIFFLLLFFIPISFVVSTAHANTLSIDFNNYISPTDNDYINNFSRYWYWDGPNTASNYFVAHPSGKNFELARSKLQIPVIPNEVIQVKNNPFRPVVGPRKVKGNSDWGEGGGLEWYIIEQIIDMVKNNTLVMIAVNKKGEVKNCVPFSVQRDGKSIEEFMKKTDVPQHKGCVVGFLPQNVNITEKDILEKIKELIDDFHFATQQNLESGVTLIRDNKRDVK